MAWWIWVLIAYFGINLIIAILAMCIGFGYEDAGNLTLLFLKIFFFGIPLLILALFYAIAKNQMFGI